MSTDTDDAGLLAAITQGIADAAPPVAPASAAPADTGATDDSDATDSLGDASAADDEAAPAGADASGDAPAGVVDDSGEPAEPVSGKEGEVDGEAAAADAASGKPDAKPDATDDATGKTPDPINDPLPNALKPATKERIKTLVSMVKDTTRERDEAVSQRGELFQAITSTRATPEQYSQALDYLTLVNGTREQREQALNFMVGEVAALAKMLGKPVPGVNMLEGEQDLINEVGEGKLTIERAQELAAARHAQRYSARVGQAEQNAQTTTQAQIKAVNDGKVALNAVEAELRRDPHYAAKKAILVKSLKPVFKEIHPSRWADTFRRAYKELPTPAPARPATAATRPPVGGGNTPLRAGNPAGGAPVAAPKTMEEAINFGISQAGR